MQSSTSTFHTQSRPERTRSASTANRVRPHNPPVASTRDDGQTFLAIQTIKVKGIQALQQVGICSALGKDGEKMGNFLLPDFDKKIRYIEHISYTIYHISYVTYIICHTHIYIYIYRSQYVYIYIYTYVCFLIILHTSICHVQIFWFRFTFTISPA